MIVGTPLHRAQLRDHYDAIIVGSGIGGLATASCLAMTGQKVLVLERHYTAGGFTHTYSRKGYEWDVGVHYIGEVHRKGSVLRRLFDHVTEGKLEWSQMSDVYDRIYLGEESFDFVTGRQNFRERMVSYFPEEEKAIHSYLDLIRKVNRASSMFYLEKTLPDWVSFFLRRSMTKDFEAYASRTTAEVLKELTHNQKLISVLTGQYGDYGLPPEQSSFAMHAMVAKHYLGGGSYPVGGSSSIAKNVTAVIEKYGGQVVTRASVDQIKIKSNKAVGVTIDSGKFLEADIVVCGVGVNNAYQLLDPKLPMVAEMLEKVKRVKPSMAHVGIYIGLKGTAEDLGLDSTNLWIYPDEFHDKNIEDYQAGKTKTFPVVYISFPSCKDPDWEKNYPGKSTIEIVAPAPYEWFEEWEGTRWRKRGEEYERFKKDLADRLIAVLLKKRPQLRDKIDYMEVSTPLSTETFSGYRKGEIYGIDHTPERFLETWLRCPTPFKGLYMTGQDIVTCGVGGALVAGFMTSISILGPIKGWPLLQKMRPQRG